MAFEKGEWEVGKKKEEKGLKLGCLDIAFPQLPCLGLGMRGGHLAFYTLLITVDY